MTEKLRIAKSLESSRDSATYAERAEKRFGRLELYFCFKILYMKTTNNTFAYFLFSQKVDCLIPK